MAKEKVILYNKAGKEFPVDPEHVDRWIKMGFSRREVVTIPAELEARLQKVTATHDRTTSAMEGQVAKLNGVVAEKEKEIEALKVEKDNLQFELERASAIIKKLETPVEQVNAEPTWEEIAEKKPKTTRRKR